MATHLDAKAGGKVTPPRHFTIGNKTYTLVFANNLRSEDGNEAWGWLNPLDLQLCLDANMCPSHMAEILLHEMLHAILLDHPIRPVAEAQEEFYVTIGAMGLVKALRDKDNAQLYRWWQYLMS